MLSMAFADLTAGNSNAGNATATSAMRKKIVSKRSNSLFKEQTRGGLRMDAMRA